MKDQSEIDSESLDSEINQIPCLKQLYRLHFGPGMRKFKYKFY